jgi:hypothetical protein
VLHSHTQAYQLQGGGGAGSVRVMYSLQGGRQSRRTHAELNVQEMKQNQKTFKMLH